MITNKLKSALAFSLLTICTSLLTPHSGRADNQAELLQQQPIVEFEAYGLANAEFAVDGNTLLVYESWKKSITEYQLNQAGVWQVIATTPIETEGPDTGTPIFQLAGDTLIYNPRYSDLNILERDDSGFWQKKFSASLVNGGLVLLDPNGTRVITLSGEYRGPYKLRIYQRNADSWSTQQQFDFSESPGGLWCFGTDRFIVGNKDYRLGTDGAWFVNSQLDTPLLTASPDCEHTRWENEDGSSYVSSGGVVSGPVQTQEHTYDSSYRFADALNEKHYAIFADKDIAIFSKLTNGDWAFQGYIAFPEVTRFAPRRITLRDSLLFVSIPLPGSVSVFDLNQVVFNQSKSDVSTNCVYGYSDTDGDGFGWEDDQSCTYPEQYITAQNSRVNELLTTDRTRAQLPAEPLTFFENKALVLLSAVGTIKFGVYTFENQNWVQTETIELTEPYLGLFNEYNTPELIMPERITAVMDEDSLLVGFPRSPLRSEPWSGRVLTYQRENNAWKLTGELERPDNVRIWTQFGNAMILRAEELIVNSKDSGYVGGYDSGFHTYLKDSEGSWSLQSQYWDERNTNAGGKMGHSFAFDDDTLITTNVNTIAGHNIVEFYRRNADGTLVPEQTVPINTRRANVLVDGDTAVIDDGGTLRLLKRNNTKFEEIAAITGGRYLVYAGKLWETDVPFALTDFEGYYPTIFWDSERNYFPVSLNMVAAENTQPSGDNAADESSSGSQLTNDNTQDESTQANTTENTDALQNGTTANGTSGQTANSGGGSVHFGLWLFLLIPGLCRLGSRGIARSRSDCLVG